TALLPLAGAAGLHVAKSLQSKPEIPPPPNTNEAAEEELIDPESTAPDKNTSVGELADKAGKDEDGTETIEFDNVKTDLPKGSASASKLKKLKSLKVPNFERFRLGFVLAGLA